MNLPSEIATLLARQPLFSNMSDEEVGRLTRDARIVNATRGEFLFHKGDPCQGFHLLLSGRIKLAFTSAQGNEKVVEIIDAGQTFGEAIMFMEIPYIVHAQALADARLLYLAKRTIDEELEKDPRLARKMLASMAMRIHQLMNDLEGYSLHSGRERIIAYLLREVAPCASPEQPFVVTLPATKGVIASRLNLTQEHFSRILHELAHDGLIRIHGREIEIPDIARLRACDPALTA